MDTDTITLLRTSVRALLQEDSDVVSGLTDLGWDEVVAEDEAAAITVLFEEHGQCLSRSRCLDRVVTSALGVDDYEVVHPPLGSADPSSILIGEHVEVDGITIGGAAPHGPLLVFTRDGTGVLVEDLEGLVALPLAGLDVSAGLHEATGRLPIGRTVDGQRWEHARGAALRALSSELVGVGRAILDLAVAQISDRQQFGRPIGSLQSPRHRLADAHVALTAAEELVRAAWTDGSAWAADVAKAQAGQAVDVTARAALQVCGAMGLTQEHALGSYVRRGFVLDAAYGGWRATSRGLGERLLSMPQLPVVGAL